MQPVHAIFKLFCEMIADQTLAGDVVGHILVRSEA